MRCLTRRSGRSSRASLHCRSTRHRRKVDPSVPAGAEAPLGGAVTRRLARRRPHRRRRLRCFTCNSGRLGRSTTLESRSATSRLAQRRLHRRRCASVFTCTSDGLGPPSSHDNERLPNGWCGPACLGAVVRGVSRATVGTSAAPDHARVARRVADKTADGAANPGPAAGAWSARALPRPRRPSTDSGIASPQDRSARIVRRIPGIAVAACRSPARDATLAPTGP